ncbi:hypothetical protein COCON_G00072240 [Conger conger]|uniref:Uncharacterized protein n=1 Tax=Conger conger TaxID=82655 RepID=A0A9Q1DMZ0_CONCO|nr:hypothetical protein COCON_G00072240 [Conger conger]
MFPPPAGRLGASGGGAGPAARERPFPVFREEVQDSAEVYCGAPPAPPPSYSPKPPSSTTRNSGIESSSGPAPSPSLSLCSSAVRAEERPGVEFGKDSLPTPSELIRRRRVRGGRVGGAQRGDVMQQGMATVLQHISDLKRRQSSIDQLKTERCWGFMAGSGAEEVGGARPADLLLGQRPPDPRTGTASFTTNLPLQNQQTEASAVRAEERPGGGVCKDSLPTPSELIRRRRVRGGRVGGAQRGDVMQQGMATVLQHISDLKRRQSSIDQLKTERCWGFMAGRGAEEVGGARPADLLLGQRPPDPRTGTASFTTNLPLQNQQIFGGGSDVMPSLAPGENPMMSFVMATANRQPHRGVCSPQLSHTEFWGFGSEE